MKSGNNRSAQRQGRKSSERIIIFGQQGAIQLSNQEELDYLPVQSSEVEVRIRKMKNRGQLQKQKRNFRYLFALFALLVILCTFILSGLISFDGIDDRDDTHEKSIQQIKVSAQERQNIIKNPTVQQVNTESIDKVLKDKIPLPNKINTPTQITQPKEKKVQIKPVVEPVVEKQEKPTTPASEKQLLQYVSQPKVQKGGNKSASYQKTWTIDLSYVNKDGKTLAEALYPDPKVRSQREIFHKQRIDFINQRNGPFPGSKMIKYNMRTNGDLDQRQKEEQVEDYLRLQRQFHYSQVQEEMPVCLVVRTYNNNAQFRVEYNLNSIFTQNYSNYIAIIANDASTDGTDLVIRRYFDFFQIPKEKYAYVQHNTRNTALENTYYAIMNICSNDSIVLVLDGDDEVLGRNTFKTFNREHQRLRGGWIYTNNYYYIHQRTLAFGMSKDYNLQQKQSIAFRSIRPQYNFHFRSFPARLFKMVPEEYFKDEKGKFYRYTQDVALFLPVMELACGHVYYVNTVNYVYNYNTGQNDWILYSNEQGVADVSIRAKKKMECLPEFKERPIIT